MSPSDLTLQINLSAGDLAYAALTVPRLVRAHPRAVHRIAVLDVCRPQRTRIFNPDTRLPEPAFSERAQRMRELASDLLAARCFDELIVLEPQSPRFAQLAQRYTARGMTETHDYGGCANMAYWAALDAPRTRFVVHYDADMCLHQEPGFDWTDEALRVWSDYPAAVFATPRISPPGFARTPADDAPSLHEGRPAQRVAAGWLNDWFSTRCFLIDRERLAPHLPLMRGTLGWEYRLRRLLDRGYPPGPETLLFRALSPVGQRCLHLADTRAWMLHPTRKDADFLAALPRLLQLIDTSRIPTPQRGYADFRLETWQELLSGTV